MEILVTVIVPVYNVEKYLKKCLESICEQTYKNLEILCIDDGSTDSSGSILDWYAQKDKRITVIHKGNAGYGHTVNMGIGLAHGKYMQIVESDDFIKSEMTEELLRTAELYRLDIVKSDYWCFFRENELEYCKICNDDAHYNKVFSVREDITVMDDRLYTWAGMYNMNFIKNNSIRHNESPGASYQDNGFWFLTMALARKIMFMDKAFYCLRRDNFNSSCFRTDMIYAMGLEYDYIKEKIMEKMNGEKQYLYIHNKYRLINSIFTAQRLDLKYVNEFQKFVHDEMDREYKEGNIDESIISPYGRKILEFIRVNDDEWFYLVKYNMPKTIVLRLNEAKSIIIYGAGKMGVEVFRQLKRFSWDIVGFAVTDRHPSEYEKEGIPVKSIYQWLNEGDDHLILIAAGKTNGEEMKQILEELNIKNYIRI